MKTQDLGARLEEVRAFVEATLPPGFHVTSVKEYAQCIFGEDESGERVRMGTRVEYEVEAVINRGIRVHAGVILDSDGMLRMVENEYRVGR